jgi:hypothetical protein
MMASSDSDFGHEIDGALDSDASGARMDALMADGSSTSENSEALMHWESHDIVLCSA